MRLITHNMLQCHVKNCDDNNFPLQFENAEVELIEAEFQPDFLVNILPRIEWNALRDTAVKLGACTSPEQTLPEQIPEDAKNNEQFLQVFHTVLLETHVKQGKMICPNPNCGHVYRIVDGIPNMLLAEHEI